MREKQQRGRAWRATAQTTASFNRHHAGKTPSSSSLRHKCRSRVREGPSTLGSHPTRGGHPTTPISEGRQGTQG
eukprot:2035494-Alexandrium_andersonii.AAC.1